MSRQDASGIHGPPDEDESTPERESTVLRAAMTAHVAAGARLGPVDDEESARVLVADDDAATAPDGHDALPTPSMRTAVMAAPSIELSSTRRRLLPTVVPNPR